MAIESATNDVKKALETNDAKAIDRTLDTLMQAQQKAAEALYKNAGTAGAGPDTGGAAPGGGNGKANDDVIDAEIVEEKKN
jgi:molecular chaperone DnaK